jgi:hypothetical protein
VDCKILENVNRGRLLPVIIEGEQEELLFVTLKLVVKDKTRARNIKVLSEIILSM